MVSQRIVKPSQGLSLSPWVWSEFLSNENNKDTWIPYSCNQKLGKRSVICINKTIAIHTLNLNPNGECKCKPHPSLCSQVLQESVPQQHPHCSGHQEGLEFAMVRPKVAVDSQQLFARNSDMSMVSSRHSFGPITRSVSNARGIPASYHHHLHMLNPCQKRKENRITATWRRWSQISEHKTGQ